MLFHPSLQLDFHAVPGHLDAVGRELGFPVERVPNLQVNGVAVVVFG